MSSRTSCLRPPVLMSTPKANNLSTGSTPEPQSSPPMGEPEIKSISFQESLRFFQEQFINSAASSPPTNLHPLKIRLRPVLTKTEEPKAEMDEISTGEKKEMSVNFTSSEIPPIPTVETILESVRILRAIQRSQAQGGTMWTLECNDADLNCNMSQLDSILSLDGSLNGNGNSDLQMTTLPQCDGFPSLDSNVSSTNGISDAVNGTDENQNPFLIPGSNGQELESKVTNLCAFWPKAMANMVKQNVDLNNLMLFDDKCNNLNAVRLSKNVTEEMCNTVNAAVSECMNISLPPDVAGSKQTIRKSSSGVEYSQHSISSLENVKDSSDMLNHETESMDSGLCSISVASSCLSNHSTASGILVNGLADEFVSRSSLLTFHETLIGNGTDAGGDRSPSALDSGIATDKSVDSFSPGSILSHFADTEASGGSSWTESSHYDSAEGSPFVSFSDIAIAQSLPDDPSHVSINDSKPDSKSISNTRQGTPACDSSCDEQGSGICEGNLDDTDMDFDTCNSSLCETDNATSPDLSERDLLVCSPYQLDRSISPKLSEDVQRNKLSDIIEDHPKSLEDVQKDRLLEIVEDSLHQVEYIPAEVVRAVPEKNIAGNYKCQNIETENETSAPNSKFVNASDIFLENGVHDNSHMNNINNSDFGTDVNDVIVTDLLNTQCNSAVTELETLGSSVTFGAVQLLDTLSETKSSSAGIDNQDPTSTKELSDNLCESGRSGVGKQNSNSCENIKLLDNLSEIKSSLIEVENQDDCDNIKLSHSLCELNINQVVVENQDVCGDIKLLDNLCEQNSAVGDLENQGTQINLVGGAVIPHSDGIVLENQICVSKMECTLSRANSLVTETENNVENVDERPKKAPTLLWDPVLLLQYLYKLDQHSFYQNIHGNDEKFSRMLKILPLGSFQEIGGFYYVVLEKNYFYCYECSETEQPLFRFPLQYATVTVYDNHTVVLDNRQGRCIHMQLVPENLNEWCATLESHCIPILSSEYVEPVHYPLKCRKDVIIVDLGSCSTRAGILMDQPTLPAVYFPTVCASDKKTNKQIYGLEALHPEVRQNSVISFPVRTSAKVTKFTMDIEALKGLFEKVFHELGITDPSSFMLQICIPRALSIQAQAALVKLLLEDLKVKSVSLTRQALLTLYAHNTSTGIVVDIGDRMDILPVVDGFILENGVSRLPYGGQRIIHHLKHSLAQKHISLSNEVESYLVQYIMENLCYIAEDYEKELQYAASFPESVKKSVPLHPFFQGDSILSNVSLDTGRFQVPEGLFNPDLWGLDSPGLHKLVHQAIQSSGVDVRRHITESIYVSGGVTLLPGFVERLEAEISQLTKPRLKPQIHASPYRNHMAYLGACKLAASDAFPQVCVTTEEWIQSGPTCLKKWHL